MGRKGSRSRKTGSVNLIALRSLPRTPADARFLSPEQQRWVARRVAEGDATTAATFGGTHPARDWKVWYWGIAT